VLPIDPNQLDLVSKGGVLLLLLVAIWWLNRDRVRLIAENKDKDEKLRNLSERAIVAMVELKGTVQGVADIFKNGSRKP
jgi:hypothetical protein